MGLIGRVRGLEELTTLRMWLDSIRLTTVGIRYVGGLSVVLVFKDKENMLEFYQTKEVWSSVFVSLEVWEGQQVPFERIAWLKIFGVPLQLYDDSVFDSIGHKVGEVIQSARVSDRILDISYALVGVLCNSAKRINQEISLKWRNDFFSVVVEEELGDWIPDCLDVDGVDLTDDSEVEVLAEKEGSDVGLANDGNVGNDVFQYVHVEENHSNVHEPSSNMSEVGIQENFCVLFSGGQVAKGGKIKKRGGFRKKPRPDKSPSPTGLKRPKKRSREGDDPFDIDRFIFNIQESSKEVEDNAGVQEKFVTPDLNVESMIREEGRNQVVEDVDKEVGETVALGMNLGVLNIDTFESSIV
ncbi:hypothetical protein HanRHA438_Chr14g0668471 [Helianthus annuus]|uniref:DUF4283 domain-containing protein n=1 Tax=Helianthus annuus TaxID=4232 RepID=A0A9K3EB20_HELAN|nr:hypothetical protein HanXRQr2_Chr14g0657531 [Helianthus annuus]KAJ0465201.1 hypothetical protein HanHA300_Chr14g0535701 [Helianthus annuus]KAJ0469957.1 hypothetical protein HanIR_Chr14g0713521 [Helianthus annuus]KAJ0486793.1 hypothetical protein HanHA89_Chr14g0583491 [Helianthus annuus]KAJ0660930.1 hypothetical protein HanOQP8_Chr14g0543101 [Helianthus annuus]